MRSRAIFFVALVLVAVPMLADAPPARAHGRRPRGHRHHAPAPAAPPATPLERLEQPQPF